ncbi:MAG: ATP-dependent Clp protease proteolytic subunit [Candidatus Yanofskybacteria bacterium]|nr:ATP-dependent Clp protease proteolytic subunit [Candidatus Yanofskybacteria bacterium]
MNARLQWPKSIVRLADGGGDDGPETLSDEEQDNLIRFYEDSLSIDLFSLINSKTLYRFTYMLKSLQKLARELNTANKKDNPDGFEFSPSVRISSEGGDAFVGFSLFDLIRTSDVPVTTIALGEVASSAMVAYLGGTKRRIYSNAFLMIHRSDPMDMNDLSRDQKDKRMALIKLLDQRIVDIVLANSKLSKERVRDLIIEEEYITARQAVKWGLAHEIITNK